MPRIVIDIDENMYQKIKGMEMLINRAYKSLELAVLEGTVLPEHHSDLIERDALLDNVKDYGEGQSKLMLIDPYYVRRADAIIPATKEGE